MLLWERSLVPFRFAHDACQHCLQSEHWRTQSCPSVEPLQGHEPLFDLAGKKPSELDELFPLLKTVGDILSFPAGLWRGVARGLCTRPPFGLDTLLLPLRTSGLTLRGLCLGGGFKPLGEFFFPLGVFLSLFFESRWGIEGWWDNDLRVCAWCPLERRHFWLSPTWKWVYHG